MKKTPIVTRLACLACAAIAILCHGCGGDTYVSGDSKTAPPVTEKTAASLKAAVDGYMTTAGAGIPGCIVAVKMNGYQPWYYATGSAEIDVATGTQRTAMKADMPFRIASVTKMFIAQVILDLAQEGKIDLKKPVDYYLPGALAGRNAANAGTITIEMLLNHTSGLYSYVTTDAGLKYGNPPTAGLPMNTFVESLGQYPWSHSFSPQDEVLTFVNTFSPPASIKIPVLNNISSVGAPYETNPYFAPGGSFEYSNTNFYLLGLLIEKVTGSTVQAEIERLITRPLGLTDTYLPTSNTFATTSHVHGYADYFSDQSYLTRMQGALLTFRFRDGKYVNGDGILEDFSYIDPSFPWTTGGMISSARDLLAFTEYVATTRVRTGQEKDKWIQAKPLDNQTDFQYSRGLAQVMNSLFGHGGQFAGYNVATYWYAPLDIYLVVMTNRYSYFESDPNNIGGTIVAGAGGLYKSLASAAPGEPGGDPDTAIINALFGALEQDPKVAKALRKSAGRSARFPRLPDVTSIMH